jgi:hypothetical protein
VIRFSASLVVVAVGLLIAGVVTSKLLLVYLAIGVSGLALLALIVATVLNWQELFANPDTAAASLAALPEPVPAQISAPATVGSAASKKPGPSLAGYLPTRDPWESPGDLIPPQPSKPPAEDPSKQPRAPAEAATPAAPGPPPISKAPTTAPESSSPEESPAPEASSGPKASSDPEASRASASPAESPAPSAPADAPPSDASEDRQHAQTEQPPAAPSAEPDPQLEVTVVPGVPRYHNARCILIRFMGEDDLEKMTVAAARDAGCTPCRACLPEQPQKSPE